MFREDFNFFQLSARSYALQRLNFTVSSTPTGRRACIDNSMQMAMHLFNTTSLPQKEALITIVWLVIRKHASCLSCMNLGAYVEAFSAHTGTYLSFSSYKPRLARASLCFNRRLLNMTLK
jgi:hypothetical protein